MPSHSLSHVIPSMLQLVVNRDSKCYRVVLVVKRDFDRVSIGGMREAHNVGMIYDCVTGAWSSSSNALSRCIFG